VREEKKMISRDLGPKIKEISKELPVIAILGPRQSGKTTLAKLTFNNHIYISLEDLDKQIQAKEDPREFLEFYKNPYGIILDEIQNAPSLLSYIQTYVDQEDVKGYFILTGSQNFLVNQSITQTLAGRIAIFTLLPLSISELKKNKLLPKTIEELIFKGSFPRLYAHKITQSIWYPSYILTYIERDVRQVTNIPELSTFQIFLKLCAGRIGQLLNVSSLANDCGISVRTATSWLSLLQASYIIFLLQPHYKNFSKRLVKTPKLYFYDTGIACSLLEIENVEQLKSHYLREGLVENLILSDLQKDFFNRARVPHLFFWRDNHGHEVDCIIEHSINLIPIEIKAGRTVASDYFDDLSYWNNLAHADPSKGYVIYAGNENQKRSKGNVLSWENCDTIIKKILK